jgi:hypothetical protein
LEIPDFCRNFAAHKSKKDIITMRKNSNIIKKGMPPYSVNSVNLLTKIGEFGHQNRRIWSAKSADLVNERYFIK